MVSEEMERSVKLARVELPLQAKTAVSREDFKENFRDLKWLYICLKLLETE